jgi:hypothetical protein
MAAAIPSCTMMKEQMCGESKVLAYVYWEPTPARNIYIPIGWRSFTADTLLAHLYGGAEHSPNKKKFHS